jgi:hypothetical protein
VVVLSQSLQLKIDTKPPKLELLSYYIPTPTDMD